MNQIVPHRSRAAAFAAMTQVLPRDLSGLEGMHAHLSKILSDKSTIEEMDAALQAGKNFLSDEASKVRFLLQTMLRDADREEIVQRLTMLLGCLISNDKFEPDILSRWLIEDVFELSPSLGALEEACKIMRRTKTFMPLICEILPVINEAEEKLDLARAKLDGLPSLLARIEDKRQRAIDRKAEWLARNKQTILDAIARGESCSRDFDEADFEAVKREMGIDL